MIYLDHAAATPVSDKVLEAMKPYFDVEFFNPSAAYLPAKKVAADYEKAKGVIAHAVGAKASDIVITAGATEANNLAFTAISARRLPSFEEHIFRRGKYGATEPRNDGREGAFREKRFFLSLHYTLPSLRRLRRAHP